MNRLGPMLARWGATLLLIAAAVLIGLWLWQHYEREPWTRDGRVRADVVRITPDVAGLVTEVAVHDNQQVKPGDLLFVVDRPRYELQLAKANAAIASARTTLAQARREAARDVALDDLVAKETHEQNLARVAVAEASLRQAMVQRDAAQLDLKRTSVRASVNGTVTNLNLHRGDYVASGQQALALIDSASLRVEGYFEETKLPEIHIGDPVEVQLMGDDHILRGRVESIAAGISDADRATGEGNLPAVNPTFSWVRLAQRIPVRVRLTEVPKGVRLISGRTATVTVLPKGAQ
ncbi:efflux RND transporter periplasmic adaptor subunit [Stakelama pacifica]|uniref:RND family efflux transporter MFP subunit n=1 Tax=Stakelama pacifica TaxID=517720 RepID=A0A4R6FCV1_9SPHN|nr:efflux RND transporter periplasmic adaptor subunit [Stakelama pacifica]TDN79026.1 RND family efflux transporter MFP subunit [Stakelama pacifica]GGO98830.1 membrane protein [Stakelama pacifica]